MSERAPQFGRKTMKMSPLEILINGKRQTQKRGHVRGVARQEGIKTGLKC